ncbi:MULTISPECIES: hypothetical protein [unclassified Kitasatospora]|uniref:hypothetical protein n=1 Tax=unclassified Kitasatospora TaxID=2633591 RepID=UPI00070AED7B|nr:MULTISPECIES: hypothetical protein [unclassified Kitasatospora]KQV23822.1 hypothetical protein ASC99_00945 [Kitasatospora sp. Root107]KRB67465.1 hypothetical protein ASE03_03790 [Kitasatospora sp. Root187]
METKMITNLTGQTVIAMPSCAPSQVGSLNGLGLNGTGVSGVVSGLGINGLGNGTFGASVETVLSLTGATLGGSRRIRNERPLQASKAAVAAAKHGDYAQQAGDAGAAKQHDEKQMKAMAALMGAKAVRMWAFRGPEPWRDQT